MVLRLAFVALLLPYVAWLLGAYRFHLLDQVNLAVHEAGHVLASPLGQLAHMLGGTLLQLAMPLAFVVAFLVKGRRFDGAVCLVWFGESLLYTATYMADAYLMVLPRVGGELHDWNWLLGRWGLLSRCQELAAGVEWLAAAALLVGLLWSGREALRPWFPGRAPADLPAA